MNIDYNLINKNFLIRVTNTKTFYRVKKIGHDGVFFINREYEMSRIIVYPKFEYIYLFDENRKEIPFLEKDLVRIKQVSNLYSARTYVMLLGNKELAEKHFKEAFESGLDKYTILLRRGLKVEFWSK